MPIDSSNESLAALPLVQYGQVHGSDGISYLTMDVIAVQSLTEAFGGESGDQETSVPGVEYRATPMVRDSQVRKHAQSFKLSPHSWLPRQTQGLLRQLVIRLWHCYHIKSNVEGDDEQDSLEGMMSVAFAWWHVSLLA